MDRRKHIKIKCNMSKNTDTNYMARAYARSCNHPKVTTPKRLKANARAMLKRLINKAANHGYQTREVVYLAECRIDEMETFEQFEDFKADTKDLNRQLNNLIKGKCKRGWNFIKN